MRETSLIGRVAFALGQAVRRTVELMAAPARVFSFWPPTPPPGPRLLPGGSSPRRSPGGRLGPAVRRETPPLPAAPIAAPLTGRLSRALVSPDPEARLLALEAISELDADGAAELIVHTLHDPDPDVRCAAAEAAARTRSAAAVFALILALDDEDLEVREEAHLAIERITERDLEFNPEADSVARRRRIEELKRWWQAMRLAQLTAELKVTPS